MNSFENEIKKTVCAIKSVAEDSDLCFCILTDSHMSDEGEDTCRNISAADREISFDFIVHLGNIINGNNPKKISEHILNDELSLYRNSIKRKKLFVTQGNTDGWRNERFAGQLAQFILTDESWYSATDFIDRYDGVSRQSNKPYYFVDIPRKNIRLIFLCSYFYQIDPEMGLYEKYTGIDVEQQRWLKTVALKGCYGKKVIIFSHKIPKSRFETGVDPYVYEGYSTESVTAILQEAKNNGADIKCWFGGGYGYDAKTNVAGINIVVMGSQLAKCNHVSQCEDVFSSEERMLATENQDLWRVVVVKKDEIRIFGVGTGKEITIKE